MRVWTLAEWQNLRARREAAAEEFLSRCDLRERTVVDQMLDNAAIGGGEVDA